MAKIKLVFGIKHKTIEISDNVESYVKNSKEKVPLVIDEGPKFRGVIGIFERLGDDVRLNIPPFYDEIYENFTNYKIEEKKNSDEKGKSIFYLVR